jgi:hypothetical protein
VGTTNCSHIISFLSSEYYRQLRTALDYLLRKGSGKKSKEDKAQI